ncbi:DNA translocase FtsK [Methylobacterium sp. J-090]|uniref:DNA translocase FtsK n=1 Tax=Methylobacterium sp. J-090 TaxID=2836666 RepID=UPI001FB95AC9|nr:DNA translocase FtsK [Methylobacterium sp. J-090]MCJ2080680.1 DNA translocase FtsK [Methylobacterium sp. J-090]
MRASGRLPYSHRDPSRPVRGGDRLGLSIGALAHRLMNLRATLARRLAGPPQRPDYTVAATRTAPSWMTSPQAFVGREAAYRTPPAAQGWPDHVFDDRATLDMIPARAAPFARPEDGLGDGEAGPRVLIRAPRRPAAIVPEADEAPRIQPHTTTAPAPAVRYTRTPDPVLQERRQRALDAERAVLAQAEAAAEEIRTRAEAERAAEAAALAAAELEAIERATREAAAATAEPLWRQPFVVPEGVRFFRSPDRRQAGPAVELPVIELAVIAEAPPAPILPEVHAADPVPDDRDWSDVPDWSEVHAWFDARDSAALDAWSEIQAESVEAAPMPAGIAPPAVAAAPAPFVAAPEDIALLRVLAPAPVYVLDRLLQFDRTATPAPADGQDNAVRALAPPSVSAAPRPPVLSAMAARAAIRSARPTAPSPAPVPFVAVFPPMPDERPERIALPEPLAFAEPAFVPTAIPSRTVLLRTPKGVPAPEPVAEAPEPEVPAESEIAPEPEAPVAVAPPIPVLNIPRAILPERPTLIAAGRHISMSLVENEDYEHPSLELLAEPDPSGTEEVDADVLEQNALNLQQTVQDFGVRGDILAVRPGPVVTLYELEPAPGTKSSRVISLSDDIARSMSAVSARVAVVPGRNVIGIELPNDTRETVYLRELLASADFGLSKHKLALCLGKNIGGEPIIADLARMPHLLVAGTTGSGKSVAINTMILSLLYRLKPEECRLIMVDPKMLELSVYDGIPHLLSPVVTDPKKAVIALKWAVREMEERYKKMSKIAVRNIDGYNARMAEARAKGEIITREIHTGFNRETGQAVYETEEMDLSALPYIVIVVDEMADLMMVAGKDIEGAIQRLAQMARAAGIHLIMATQRPSVDVITGTIKANFPTRISFQVTSKIDSRTILGEMGAEQLLGQGDMLFMAGGGRTTRVHGPFCSDSEVESVVAHLKRQGRPSYLEAVTTDDSPPDEKPAKGSKADKAEKAQALEAEDLDVPIFDGGAFAATGGIDPGAELYDQAVQVVMRDKKASTSYIQRRLQIGYNRAASIMERMEIEGIVGPANHAGKREILMEGGPSSMMDYDD